MDLFDKNGRHLWGWRTPACFANEAKQEICSLQTTVLQINGRKGTRRFSLVMSIWDSGIFFSVHIMADWKVTEDLNASMV